MMHRVLAAFLAALWLLTPAVQAAEQPFIMVMSKEPQPIPELQFTDEAGKTHTLAEFKGKVVLLNVWATWCAPCRKEFPTLDRLEAALGGPDFAVVPLSIDRQGFPAIDKFYGEVNVQHLPRFLSTGSNSAFDTLGIFGLPETLLIDRKGEELGRRAGPAEWDSPEIIAFLKDIIAKQKETQP